MRGVNTDCKEKESIVVSKRYSQSGKLWIVDMKSKNVQHVNAKDVFERRTVIREHVG